MAKWLSMKRLLGGLGAISWHSDPFGAWGSLVKPPNPVIVQCFRGVVFVVGNFGRVEVKFSLLSRLGVHLMVTFWEDSFSGK